MEALGKAVTRIHETVSGLTFLALFPSWSCEILPVSPPCLRHSSRVRAKNIKPAHGFMNSVFPNRNRTEQSPVTKVDTLPEIKTKMVNHEAEMGRDLLVGKKRRTKGGNRR
jgi:hypothetical protein